MMEKDITQIVAEKEFIELTEMEREELSEFCTNEDEFNQLKHVFQTVEGMSFDPPQPKAETKEKLDQLFYETYPKAAPVWYNTVLAVIVPKEKPLYRQPLLQVAAVALLLFLVVPVFQNKVGTNDNTQLAQEVSDDRSVSSEKSEVVMEEAPGSANEQESTIEEAVSEPLPAIVTEQPTTTTSFFSSTRPENGTAGSAEAPGSNHPDGIFIGDIEAVAISIPASESEDLLDLLTATF